MTRPHHRSLRRDPRGWQIEDDDAAEATIRALEVLGGILAHMVLHRYSHAGFDPVDPNLDLALRGLGTVSGRLATSRLAYLSGVDDTGASVAQPSPNRDDNIAGEHLRAVLDWMLEYDPTNPDTSPQLRKPSPPPPSVRIALDELWAAATYFDRRARGQGTAGPGERRRIMRETSRRKA